MCYFTPKLHDNRQAKLTLAVRPSTDPKPQNWHVHYENPHGIDTFLLIFGNTFHA